MNVLWLKVLLANYAQAIKSEVSYFIATTGGLQKGTLSSKQSISIRFNKILTKILWWNSESSIANINIEALVLQIEGVRNSQWTALNCYSTFLHQIVKIRKVV